MTRQYLDDLAGGSFVEDGWTYHADYSHIGSLSCDKETLIKKGVIDLWEAPTEDDWETEIEVSYFQEYWDEYKNSTDPEILEEKAQFMNRYTATIGHCFYVTDPDGNGLDYGHDTPHGKVGSKEFTLWYNGLPLDTLTYADMDSWCDG